ncbi:MAG: hypothetical protein ACKOWC_03880 [Limnohabitans sp.]
MTDKIIEASRDARLGTVLCHNSVEGDRVWIEGADWHDELARFYAIAYRAGLEDAAKVAEEWKTDWAHSLDVADAIRALMKETP